MYRAPTYRHVDQAVKLLGLEVEDWGAFLLIMTAGTFLLPASGLLGQLEARVLAVILAIGTTLVLRRLKRGKPRGYLKYLLHRWGLSRLLFGPLRLRGLLPAPFPWQSRLSLLVAARPRRKYHANV